MPFLADLRQRWFPKGVTRTLQRNASKLLRRTTERDLVSCFSKLSIAPGSVICVHSRISGLGYLVDGPESVIRTIQRAVPDCTIMMPTFPFDGSCFDYVKERPIFDPARTPSQSGLLSEVLRKMPGAVRSLHPTHSCVALGRQASELIAGSEKSPTPFGDDSTYGRFSQMEQAVLLLIHTNNTSFVHRIQEMVDMPNLFLPDLYTVRGLDQAGALHEYQVRVHRPEVPLYVILEGDEPDTLQYVWFPDYALAFPKYNRDRIVTGLRSQAVIRFLLTRHDELLSQRAYTTASTGNAEVMGVRVGPWQERLCNDVHASVQRFAVQYGMGKILEAQRQGRLKH